MSDSTPTRRKALLGGFAGCAVAMPVTAWAQAAASSARFGGVRVDARPLADIGGGASADLVQRLLPAKLQTVFADLLGAGDRRAPLLVARVDRLYLTGFADNTTPGFTMGPMDSMEGAGLVVAGGQPQSTTPLRVTLSPSYSGAYYLPDIDARRIDSLCYQFAYWLRREMSL